MKCWFCDEQARGTCAACGRGLCHQHAHIHDETTIAKSDTSTGYASYYNVYGALKCSECRLEWKTVQPRGGSAGGSWPPLGNAAASPTMDRLLLSCVRRSRDA